MCHISLSKPDVTPLDSKTAVFLRADLNSLAKGQVEASLSSSSKSKSFADAQFVCGQKRRFSFRFR